ncbi:hypothetical protein FOZ63_006775 [Perkinsus olseni]|uniref:Uncharacterized protein n=1 Tax=Perkinsus olseni TaxID=32597 RepID=A0A7J6R9D3_PEROL|nr:hypothetical protein FOZ63_006775 [Perkinsus olseni]
MLPAGTYKAVKQNGGGVCPELPDLIDFEMVVWDGPRGQMATFGFLERQEALAGHRPFSSESTKLVWYNGSGLKSLRGFGTLRIDRQTRCFHGSVTAFMKRFYSSLKLTGLLQLIVCNAESGLVVGFGPRKPEILDFPGLDPRERDILYSVGLGKGDGEITQYGFRLARQVSVDEDTARVSERTRKRISHPQSKKARQNYSTKDAGTPVNGRQEQVSNHVHDAAIPSFELPTTAQSTSLGAQQAVGWIDTSFRAQGAYYSPLPAELFAGYSRGPLAPPEHSSISTIIPSSGGHNRGGVVERWAVIPDGEYETTNVDVDQLERVTVEIRSELQTGQPRVQLTAKFKGFEMKFSEETAVFFGDCLHLDFSAEFHDSDMFIFKDSLKFDYVYPSSFRICRRAAGGWFFMFDARRSSNGAAISTLHLRLREIVPRKE